MPPDPPPAPPTPPRPPSPPSSASSPGMLPSASRPPSPAPSPVSPPSCSTWARIAAPAAAATPSATGSTRAYQRGVVASTHSAPLRASAGPAGASNVVTGSSQSRATATASSTARRCATPTDGSPLAATTLRAKSVAVAIRSVGDWAPNKDRNCAWIMPASGEPLGSARRAPSSWVTSGGNWASGPNSSRRKGSTSGMPPCWAHMSLITHLQFSASFCPPMEHRTAGCANLPKPARSAGRSTPRHQS